MQWGSFSETPAELYYKATAKSMGKRELLLITAFLIVGAVVYQATAPPAGPNERSFSFSGIVEHIRREMRGNRANAEATRVIKHELGAGMNEVRIAGTYGELTITGEDRPDIEVRFRVSSNGYDEAEARRFVEQSELKADRTEGALRFTSVYPTGGRQRAFLTLLVPSRLNVRVDQGSPRTTVSNVAGLDMPGVRGETALKKIAGRVTVNHRGGRINIEDIATLKFTGRGSDATVTRVRGDASFSLQSGELTATSIRGPIDLESQNADITFRKLDEAQGPLRVNATAGSVTLEGLRGDARIDGRNTEIDIAMSKPGAVAVYNEGDEPIEITPPSGGFVIDALATEGRITVPDDLRSQLSMRGDEDGKERRANGSVRGGGPTITLRANRGDITIRAREIPKSER
jgi:hypothetical protein